MPDDTRSPAEQARDTLAILAGNLERLEAETTPPPPPEKPN